MFAITFVLLLYAKFCHRGSSAAAAAAEGDRDGLECAVCISKFEDVEILRLLPQCKHAFHINCIDELGLFVQREESGRRSSSRFSIGGSFRKAGSKSGRKEDRTPILEETGDGENGAFKNRWSSVGSSDLMFLSSEMLNDAAGERFSSLDKSSGTQPAESSSGNNNYLPADANAVNYSRGIVGSPADRRAVSELTGVSRFRSLGVDSGEGPVPAEERQRQAWIPIVRRTAEWFANREKRKTAAETLDV
ncbi:unnamed protein product [Linum tenue]|uniref:RING-type domain-containing protein n=1 Tax=Linum tenue TaxID=586396 RepID=A0AAV0S7F4_9ROSI|nr:unnamed protein product [Linum tenue]